MSKKEGLFIIKSDGVLDFYYSTQCFVEKAHDVFTVTFGNLSLDPPNLLALAVSPRTLSAFNVETDEEEDTLKNKLNFIDFRDGEGCNMLKIDFKMFTIVFLRTGAEYKKTEYGAKMEFNGFLTKEDKKTEDFRFFVEIHIL